MPRLRLDIPVIERQREGMLKTSLVSLLGILFLVNTGLANELILSQKELLRRGYKPVARAQATLNDEGLNGDKPDFAPHSLRWPVPFEDSRHTIGNVMTQFQDYGGGAYYHGGDDLRVREAEWVTAPVTGKLEAGHYGYDTKPDGSHQKYWMPWPQQGSSMYFEVALVTPQGYRFELHHINRNTLPRQIVDALNAGNVTIAAGTPLGRTVVWPNSDTDDTTYNHTHYNIVAPDGTNLNPEHYSVSLGDTVAPEIESMYAVNAASTGVPFGDGRFATRPEEFVVVAHDQLGENVYAHTPSYSRIVFDSGEQTVWDFRERLAGADGRFPPIWDFLRESLSLEGGQTLSTRGDYSSRVFLLRLKVPSGARGKFRIEIGDSAGNIATRTGEIL